MATLGQPLTTPEAGWKRYDDTHDAFKYDIGWSDFSHSNGYNGSYKTNNSIANLKIKFIFTGTRIRILSTKNTIAGSNVIIIDGVKHTFDSYSSTPVFQSLVYEKTGLSDSEHFVEIYTESNKSLVFDAIDIDATGTIKYPTINKILLLSKDGKVNSFEKGGYSENLIPVMTSDNAPSGIASASGVNSTQYAYLAFDDSASSTFWQVSEYKGWIQYDFLKPIQVDSYSISRRRGTQISIINSSPKSWTFEGWDGSQWVVLDTQVNQTNWEDNGVENYYYFDNKNSYLKYRLNIVGSVGGAQVIALNSFKMFKSIDNKLNQYSSHSEQNFIKYGMDSPVQLDGIFSSKDYILQDTVSENEEGLWTTQLNRKPLSIRFD